VEQVVEMAARVRHPQFLAHQSHMLVVVVAARLVPPQEERAAMAGAAMAGAYLPVPMALQTLAVVVVVGHQVKEVTGTQADQEL
jgi:hypothetical protein